MSNKLDNIEALKFETYASIAQKLKNILEKHSGQYPACMQAIEVVLENIAAIINAHENQNQFWKEIEKVSKLMQASNDL